jgi:hypothetical protein
MRLVIFFVNIAVLLAFFIAEIFNIMLAKIKRNKVLNEIKKNSKQNRLVLP